MYLVLFCFLRRGDVHLATRDQRAKSGCAQTKSKPAQPSLLPGPRSVLEVLDLDIFMNIYDLDYPTLRPEACGVSLSLVSLPWECQVAMMSRLKSRDRHAPGSGYHVFECGQPFELSLSLAQQ